MNNIHNLYLYKVILAEGCYLMYFVQNLVLLLARNSGVERQKYGILLANMERSK
jgi:hypothetical protein